MVTQAIIVLVIIVLEIPYRKLYYLNWTGNCSSLASAILDTMSLFVTNLKPVITILKPAVGLEPTTYGLQNRSSTN
jgi:hypothetical protein